MAFVSFHLPMLPPPLSACFANVAKNGRADTARYKEFKRAVDGHLAKNCKEILGTPYKANFIGEVVVHFTLRRPDRRKRDLDNFLKSLADLLVRNFIIQDDSHIIDLTIRWGALPPDKCVQISIWNAP